MQEGERRLVKPRTANPSAPGLPAAPQASPHLREYRYQPRPTAAAPAASFWFWVSPDGFAVPCMVAAVFLLLRGVKGGELCTGERDPGSRSRRR